MERLPNNNPWADKLQEVSLPDVGEGWTGMSALLDKEMPDGKKKDRRRWLLLLLLLLVLSGSGYFVWRTHTVTMRHPTGVSSAPMHPAAPTQSSTPTHVAAPTHAAASTSSAPPTSTTPMSTPPAPTLPVATPLPLSGSSPAMPQDASATATSTAAANHSSPSHSPKTVYSLAHPSYPAGAGGRAHPGRHSVPHRWDHKADLSTEASGSSDHKADRAASAKSLQQYSLRHSNPGKIQPLGIAGPHLVVKVIARSKATDPLKCPPVGHSKGTNFVFAIGLNQGIPVDGQQVWTNPSGGLNTWWKNYIPVPSIRYYVRPNIYLQLEARIHAPQYTPRDLAFIYQYNDTFYSGWIEIKKLFYFQLPVSIHYSPSDNWSVGLGVQYSHYGKGIAAISDSSVNTYYAVEPLSNFPMAFVKNPEFRGLASVDYTYEHWVLGISYDKAFTRSITVKVPDPVATQQAAIIQPLPSVRNSSLQLYLRYILWDGRKKKPLLPAK